MKLDRPAHDMGRCGLLRGWDPGAPPRAGLALNFVYLWGWQLYQAGATCGTEQKGGGLGQSCVPPRGWRAQCVAVLEEARTWGLCLHPSHTVFLLGTHFSFHFFYLFHSICPHMSPQEPGVTLVIIIGGFVGIQTFGFLSLGTERVAGPSKDMNFLCLGIWPLCPFKEGAPCLLCPIPQG